MMADLYQAVAASPAAWPQVSAYDSKSELPHVSVSIAGDMLSLISC